MNKTSIFKRNIPLKNVSLEDSPKEFRSEYDAHVAASLGLKLSKTSELISDEIIKEIATAKKKKEFYPYSEYLKSFVTDFWSVPEEFRARYVAVWDFETTDKFNSYACSMAIELVDLVTFEVVDSFYKVMNPLAKISKGAYDTHGISQKEAESQPTFEAFYEDIKEILLKADFFVGQNLIFDLAVLERELLRINKVNSFNQVPVFDTMKAGKGFIPSFNKNGRIKAPTLTEICLGLDLIELDENGNPPIFHNAEVDVKYTRLVFLALLDSE